VRVFPRAKFAKEFEELAGFERGRGRISGDNIVNTSRRRPEGIPVGKMRGSMESLAKAGSFEDGRGELAARRGENSIAVGRIPLAKNKRKIKEGQTGRGDRTACEPRETAPSLASASRRGARNNTRHEFRCSEVCASALAVTFEDTATGIEAKARQLPKSARRSA